MLITLWPGVHEAGDICVQICAWGQLVERSSNVDGTERRSICGLQHLILIFN